MASENRLIEVGGLSVRLGEPKSISVSKPGEQRWGYHQFPTISRLPTGPLLITYNVTADRDAEYGLPGPAHVSYDRGMTWEKWVPHAPMLAISHSVISEINNGEHLCVPMSPSLDIDAENIQLPKVSGRMNVYGEVLFYKYADCESRIQAFLRELNGVRWTPGGGWQRETILWDVESALVRTRKSDYVIPRAYLDNRILRVEDSLLYPDFHLQHLLPDGSHPKNYACWLMCSEDNGRSWKRKGLIAYDDSGKLMMGEPCLFSTQSGGLACVIRCTDHQQRPMLISYSDDQGENWSEPVELHKFGVMPQGLLLENGISVVSFGRPGVHLMFSQDDSAKSWSNPIELGTSDEAAPTQHSCGYTRILAISDDSFLIVYSEFTHVSNGQRCKAIIVRRITVNRLRMERHNGTTSKRSAEDTSE